MGKEYTLCRVISIRIAVSAVKNYTPGWPSVSLSVGLRRKIIKIEHDLFCRKIIVATDAIMSIMVVMNIIVIIMD